MIAIIVPIAVIVIIIGIFLVFSKSSPYRENINIREERSWIPSNFFEKSKSPTYVEWITAPTNIQGGKRQNKTSKLLHKKQNKQQNKQQNRKQKQNK